MRLWIDELPFFETYPLDFRVSMPCQRVELDRAVFRPVGSTDFPIRPRGILWIPQAMIRPLGCLIWMVLRRPCALRRAFLFNPDEIIFYMLSPTGSPRTTMLWKYSITPESETSKAGHCGQSNVSFMNGSI